MIIFLLCLTLIAACSHRPELHNSKRLPSSDASQRFEMPERNLGSLLDHGFSGLSFEGKDSEGNLIFWANSDRGPNPDPFVEATTGLMSRIFVIPSFQPHLTRFKFRPSDNTIEFLQTVPLTLPNGKPFSGLPNFLPTSRRIGDELPLSVDGSILPMDLMGIDPEGICKVDDGFWISDEYGPSLLKFDGQGKLLHRFVPKGYYSKSEIKKLNKLLGRGVIKANLPEILLQRQQNRGFESLACGPEKLYVGLQSPIKAGTLQIPIIEFDLRRKKVSRVLIHILDSVKADKLGDFTLHNDKLLVIEQNSKVDGQAFKKVYALDLIGNIVTKTLVLDLVQAGLGDIEKLEGIAKIDDDTLALINDNESRDSFK
jgi:hypothetical protein